MAVSDNTRGLILAMVSSLFIGTSFILKKKGLRRAAEAGLRAELIINVLVVFFYGVFDGIFINEPNTYKRVGGYTYLLQPLWWAGMITMIVGEVANFVAYIYAPAVLVTPLGALSIIISAVLAHFMLKERLRQMGILGCVSCIVGSVVIVIHAPQEHTPASVQEVWILATQPAFLVYVTVTLSIVGVLMLHFEPAYGQTNILVYLGICSLMGALTVVSIKAIGIAIKLTLEGMNQFRYPYAWVFLSVTVVCVITQLNYLNKALDTFNAAMVSPIYYVMFTTLTITASAIMFKDWSGQNMSSITSEICGFITVLSGTIILHLTREEEHPNATGSITWYDEDPSKGLAEAHYITLNNSDYFH